MNSGPSHRLSSTPAIVPDGFEELAQAIWPTVAKDSPLAEHQPRLHSLLAELMRRASTGIGSLPLTEAGLSADERIALERWTDCIAIEGSALVLQRYAQQLREIRSFVEARLRSQDPRLPDAEVAPPSRANPTTATNQRNGHRLDPDPLRQRPATPGHRCPRGCAGGCPHRRAWHG